jgi:hypothetical protein
MINICIKLGSRRQIIDEMHSKRTNALLVNLAPYWKGTGSSVSPIKWSGNEAVVKNAIATVPYVTSWYAQRQILCFVDRASFYNLVNKANLVHN